MCHTNGGKVHGYCDAEKMKEEGDCFVFYVDDIAIGIPTNFGGVMTRQNGRRLVSFFVEI